MFLPLGTEPKSSGTPIVNGVLIGLNILVYVLICFPQTLHAPDTSDPVFLEYLRLLVSETHLPASHVASHISAYDLFIFKYGFRPAAPSFSHLITAMFLHAGWLHLLGNMLFLWIFGRNVELRVGHSVYAILYVLTGIAATLFFAGFRLDSSMPMVGASGAISGVLGCYFVWFPSHRVRMLAVLIWYMDVILVPARWVLGFYIVFENLLPFLSDPTSASGVAYGAHLGGFIAGAGFAWFSQRRHPTQGPPFQAPFQAQVKPPWDLYPSTPANLRVTPDIIIPADDSDLRRVAPSFEDRIKARHWDDALDTYLALDALERRQLHEESILTLADHFTEAQRCDAALTVLQRLIAIHPSADILARTHLRVGLLYWHGMGRPTPARQHLLMVLDLNPSWDVAQAARHALADIARTQSLS